MRFTDLDFDKTYSYAHYFKWKMEERVEVLSGFSLNVTDLFKDIEPVQ